MESKKALRQFGHETRIGPNVKVKDAKPTTTDDLVKLRTSSCIAPHHSQFSSRPPSSRSALVRAAPKSKAHLGCG
jgi:hypothetical protein